MTAESGFAGRLAYVRWLRNRGRIAPETDRELAQALGVGEKWLAKWKSRPDAPEGRREANAIEAALAPLGVTVAWLYDGEGQPPEPSMWAVWSGQGQAAPLPGFNRYQPPEDIRGKPLPHSKDKPAKKRRGQTG